MISAAHSFRIAATTLAGITSLGNDQWQIHSGLDAHNETITLGNGASIHVTDFLFV